MASGDIPWKSRNSLNGLSLFNPEFGAHLALRRRSRNSLNGLSLFNLSIQKLTGVAPRSQFPKRPFALQPIECDGEAHHLKAQKSQFPKRPFALQHSRSAPSRAASACRNSLNGLSLFNEKEGGVGETECEAGRNSLNGLSLFNASNSRMVAETDGTQSQFPKRPFALQHGQQRQGREKKKRRNSLNGLSLFNHDLQGDYP